MYDELAKKINAIQTTYTSDLVKKIKKKKIQKLVKNWWNRKTNKKNNKFDHDHDKYITTETFNNRTKRIAAKLKEAKLASKFDIADFAKKAYFGNTFKKLSK